MDLNRPLGGWKRTWAAALKTAGLHYRWHDQRHTFVSRLAAHPTISETTLKALSGHVSKRMLEHYSHVHANAKQAAIQTLEAPTFDPHGAQNWAQATSDLNDEQHAVTPRPLN